MQKLFGTDGIRGKANEFPMDAKTALAVGRAIAIHFKSGVEKRMVLIGQDTRISGDMLAHALASGIASAGMDAGFLGVVPTPGVAFLTSALSASAGVVISASHNPFEDNGIKVFAADGYKLSDEQEGRIETLIQNNSPLHLAPDNLGRLHNLSQASDKYVDFLIQSLEQGPLTGLRIVLDCAHGATFDIAPTVFQRLGAWVHTLFCDPNGININDQCGSQHPQQLCAAVRELEADIGLAFDGDGDRLIAVDETGAVLSGDRIMVICAGYFKRKGRLKNGEIVSTVMSNLGFHHALADLGIQVCTTQVGDRYVIEKMKEIDATIGGEDSGHIIFRDRHTTGDGLLAALRLVDAMRSAGQPLSQLAKLMKVFPQELINVPVTRKPPFDTIPAIPAAIKQAEQQLSGQGRVLVRYSGTQNECRVMVEGPTVELTRALCRQIAETVRHALS